jgi:hypothetical protein
MGADNDAPLTEGGNYRHNYRVRGFCPPHKKGEKQDIKLRELTIR